jgi:hypothetical protein
MRRVIVTVDGPPKAVVKKGKRAKPRTSYRWLGLQLREELMKGEGGHLTEDERRRALMEGLRGG